MKLSKLPEVIQPGSYRHCIGIKKSLILKALFYIPCWLSRKTQSCQTIIVLILGKRGTWLKWVLKYIHIGCSDYQTYQDKPGFKYCSNSHSNDRVERIILVSPSLFLFSFWNPFTYPDILCPQSILPELPYLCFPGSIWPFSSLYLLIKPTHLGIPWQSNG